MHPVLKLVYALCLLWLSAFCGLWAFFAARNLSFVTVAVAAGIFVTFVFGFRTALFSATVSPRVESTGQGTLVSPDSRIDRYQRRMVITGTLSSGLCVAAWLCGFLYVPLDDLSYIAPLLSGIFGTGTAWMWWQRAHLGSFSLLFLSPDAVEFPTLLRVRHERWDDVVAINDRMPSGDEEFWNPMVFSMRNGKHLRFEAPGTFTPKGTALVEWTRFYWQHPEQRDELTDDRGAERLRQYMRAKQR